jgi:hypothetical protein
MKTRILTATLMLLASTAALSSPDDAEHWFKNQYASLWAKNSWGKIESIAHYYDVTISLHSAEGNVIVVDSKPWLKKSIAGWRAEGWLGSDVPVLQVDELNDATVVFKSKWRDHYEDGSEEFSCAWYMADRKDGHWVFTAYAELDCDEHNL